MHCDLLNKVFETPRTKRYSVAPLFDPLEFKITRTSTSVEPNGQCNFGTPYIDIPYGQSVELTIEATSRVSIRHAYPDGTLRLCVTEDGRFLEKITSGTFTCIYHRIFVFFENVSYGAVTVVLKSIVTTQPLVGPGRFCLMESQLNLYTTLVEGDDEYRDVINPSLDNIVASISRFLISTAIRQELNLIGYMSNRLDYTGDLDEYSATPSRIKYVSNTTNMDSLFRSMMYKRSEWMGIALPQGRYNISISATGDGLEGITGIVLGLFINNIPGSSSALEDIDKKECRSSSLDATFTVNNIGNIPFYVGLTFNVDPNADPEGLTFTINVS